MISRLTLIDESVATLRIANLFESPNVANSGKTRMCEQAEQVQSTCPSSARLTVLLCPQVHRITQRRHTKPSCQAKKPRGSSFVSLAFRLPQQLTGE